MTQDGKRIELSFDIESQDLTAFIEYYFRHAPEGRRSMWRIYLFGGVLFAVLAYSEAGHPEHGLDNPARYALLLLVSALLMGAGFYFYLRVLRPMLAGCVTRTKLFRERLGPTTMVLTPDEISVRNEHGHGRMDWEPVREVAADKQHYYIMFGGLRGFVVPKRAFASEADAAAAHEQMAAWAQNAG